MTGIRLKGSTILIILLFSLSSCSFHLFQSPAHRTEKQIAGHSRRYRESRKVRRAKEQQETRQAKLKKDYGRSVTKSKKRTYEIQSPEVQARMRRNAAAINKREKRKDKKDSLAKKASKKYN